MTADGNRTQEIMNALGMALGEPSVAVVGCGGAGGNVVHNIYWRSNRIQTVAVNTDEEHLRELDAHRKVLIGKDVSFGRDAGGFPEVGEHCAEKARSVIKEALRGYDIVFVVAGMGGGTGTGVAPIVSSVAKELSSITFALPIVPFEAEGSYRNTLAKEGIDRLKETADFTVVLDNNKLAAVAPDIPISEALRIVDRSIMRIVETVCDHTSSYVTGLLEDMSSYAATLEETTAHAPPEHPGDSFLVHAELDPTFDGFGPSMYG